ncbi:BapA/Bap/LapF family prefix-like domain-containing protein [Enterobacter hormaechei]|uniref:BapA/Bap/LapF family prefix-like domain-containing protein n=1 Tax=Enterobacter hormaechei TaxID=158836 RepID=UPI003C6BE1CB
MKDGSVIRCNNYFVEDTETHNHSELVFNDNQALTHIHLPMPGKHQRCRHRINRPGCTH